jgi:FMN phosphatase YigB (HAD superfamily)
VKLTVLIDLDDTLLTNDMEVFLKAYLHALGTALAPHIAPEKMIPQLLSATGKMTGKTSPLLKLEEIFDRNFYPALGVEKAALADSISKFYQDEYPKIKVVTSPRKQAIDLMSKIISKGWDVVIATNPLFPQTAARQRVIWAGLNEHLSAINHITSFDSYHFSKPNPAYFAEILGQIGWPNQPVVMVGNSLSDDILPAASLGMPVFWLNNNAQALPDKLKDKGECGTLDSVFPWLEGIAERGIPIETKDPKGLLAVLASTPAALDTLCARLDDEGWKRRPAENEWSPVEIVCHLRDVDCDVNIPRMHVVVAEENPFLPAVETDPWAEERSYWTQNGPAALAEFIHNRIKFIDLLTKLPPEGWNLPARHAIFGPTTLHELVEIIISHDQTHLNQIVRALSI